MDDSERFTISIGVANVMDAALESADSNVPALPSAGILCGEQNLLQRYYLEIIVHLNIDIPCHIACNHIYTVEPSTGLVLHNT